MKNKDNMNISSSQDQENDAYNSPEGNEQIKPSMLSNKPAESNDFSQNSAKQTDEKQVSLNIWWVDDKILCLHKRK